jgi:hypothetical protein
MHAIMLGEATECNYLSKVSSPPLKPECSLVRRIPKGFNGNCVIRIQLNQQVVMIV